MNNDFNWIFILTLKNKRLSYPVASNIRLGNLEQRVFRTNGRCRAGQIHLREFCQKHSYLELYSYPALTMRRTG